MVASIQGRRERDERLGVLWVLNENGYTSACVLHEPVCLACTKSNLTVLDI